MGVRSLNYLCRNVSETGYLAAERFSRPTLELANLLKNDVYWNFRYIKLDSCLAESTLCVHCKDHSVNAVQENNRCFLVRIVWRTQTRDVGKMQTVSCFSRQFHFFSYWTFRVWNRCLYNFGALSLRCHTSCFDFPANPFIRKLYCHVYVWSM